MKNFDVFSGPVTRFCPGTWSHKLAWEGSATSPLIDSPLFRSGPLMPQPPGQSLTLTR